MQSNNSRRLSLALTIAFAVTAGATTLRAQASWSLQYPPASATLRWHAGMTFDEARGVALLLFGSSSSGAQ